MLIALPYGSKVKTLWSEEDTLWILDTKDGVIEERGVAELQRLLLEDKITISNLGVFGKGMFIRPFADFCCERLRLIIKLVELERSGYVNYIVQYRDLQYRLRRSYQFCTFYFDKDVLVLCSNGDGRRVRCEASSTVKDIRNVSWACALRNELFRG